MEVINLNTYQISQKFIEKQKFNADGIKNIRDMLSGMLWELSVLDKKKYDLYVQKMGYVQGDRNE